jgi:2-succinyl-5-enolpyruvyl-6-hydroxy-3-cyclohexene-1-carboxylate synthase
MAEPSSVLKAVEKNLPVLDSSFSQLWTALDQKAEQVHQQYLGQANWSDLKAFDTVLKNIPEKSILQMASSSPVRYVQLFKANSHIKYYSNRGVSGIDGCTSTAVGMAMNTDDIVTLVTGDMSFYYDSNALWHKYLPSNLRIIVINNGGGGIFRIIPGPSGAAELEDFFEAHMENRVEKLAKVFDVDYVSVDSDESLQSAFQQFYQGESAKILEVFTPRLKNAEVLAAYFKQLKQ